MDVNYWLTPGKQTRITPLVKEHADNIRNYNSRLVERMRPFAWGFKNELETIAKTCEYIGKNIPLITIDAEHSSVEDIIKYEKMKKASFRKRSADEMLRDGRYPFCTDNATLARALSIAQGVPVSWLETFHASEIYSRNDEEKGHVLLKAYNQRCQSVILNIKIDPLNPELDVFFKDWKIYPYIIYKEGLDSSDLKIHFYRDSMEILEKNRKELLVRCQNIENKRFT